MRKRMIIITSLFVLMGFSIYLLIKIKEPVAVSVDIPKQEEIKEDREISISAVGDIMLGRYVATLIKSDYEEPFSDVIPALKDSDIRFGNLECVLSSEDIKSIKGKPLGFCLKGPIEMRKVLKSGMLDIVSLANNHTYDFDDKGLASTINTLKEDNILYVGAGQDLEEARSLKVIEKDGLKVGFLAYSDLAYSNFSDKNQIPAANKTKSGVAPLEEKYILEDIKKNRNKCDLLFVSLHWGIEYTHVPQKSQRNLAYNIIDAGADGILGHHAHNLQGVEIYKYKPIIYSMSNFIFDQNADLNKDSGIFKLKYKGTDFKELEFIPLRIEDKKRTVIAEGEARRKILDHMIKYSKVLNTEFEEKDEKLYIVIKN